ncbi:ski oncogene-like [Bombina bombina]|uniref:ski oncogene-like n=1 Tax=Bombina bombina TaxID=8345 RepID=UPI00235B046D|nr:ski oncogene-like [Bombina bombina]
MSYALSPTSRSSPQSLHTEKLSSKPSHFSEFKEQAMLGSTVERPQPMGSCGRCSRLKETICHLEQEKEEALKDLRESFQRQLAETALNRRHLEEERMAQLRRTLERQTEQELQRLHQTWEAKSLAAVGAACQETRKEIERDREQEMQKMKEAAQEEFKQQLQDALSKLMLEEKRHMEEQKEVIEQKHTEELQLLQKKICDLQEQLEGVVKEKMEFECHFKELQLNYKRFIDLTESSLHSDYLLRLIRLGEPPGYAHHAVQTDDELIFPPLESNKI